MFSKYDIVIIHNTRTVDTLESEIIDFVLAHKDNQKLIVVAYLPQKKTALSSPPLGVDIISSASQEDPAQDLVIHTLVPLRFERIV